VLAGDAGDTVTALDGTDVVIGDNGQATWTGGVLTQFRSANTGAGGNDTINVGTAAGVAGKNFVIGGVGQDGITGGENDDVVLGDNGIVNFTAGGVITDATVTEAGTGDVDTIDVRGGNNVVLAGAGGDSVTALGGVDVVIGDNGQATWTGGVLTQIRSSDTTAGTGGDDTISVGAGRNYVVGGVGADGITAGADDDVVLGDNGVVNFTTSGVITDASATELGLGGADTIDAGGGNNVVIGGAAGDTVTTDAGNDVILGDNGNLTFTAGVLTEAVTTDTSDATGGNDVLNAGDGVNVVLGGVGNDTITTGAGDDVIVGDNGIAQFDSSGARQLIESRDPQLAGDDTIDSGAGNDVVIGGSGADSIQGGAGNDVLIGDGGTATFTAGELSQIVGDSTVGDADFISGGSGNDILLGGAGDDTLSANLTDDLFTGGNARILFSGGLVTEIDLIDGIDLVLQSLFDAFSSPGVVETLVVEGGAPAAGVEESIAAFSDYLSGFGVEGIFSSDGTLVQPGLDSLSFSFGRGVPLAQIPELLRNIVLELSLGAGIAPPGHGGESGGAEGGGLLEGEGQGEGAAQAAETLALSPATVQFAVEAQASTLPPEPDAAPSESQEALALAAGAAALAGTRPGVRTVQGFDPATGRFAERTAQPAPAGPARLDRTEFAPRSIDW
jgi:Ca2+-binding RTX toxin-like protein